MTAFTQSVKFSVVNNPIRLFDFWFLDLRDFLVFMPGYESNSPNMNIRTISFEPLGTSLFGPNYILNYWYGYYQLDFSQAEQENTHIWV